MTVGDLVVGQLLGAGVRTLFGGAGRRRQPRSDRRQPAGAGCLSHKAKAVVPDGHPWFAGVFSNATIEQRMIDECDLLIGMGLDPVELIPAYGSASSPSSTAAPGTSTRTSRFALAGSFWIRSWTVSTDAELDRAAGEALVCEGANMIEAKIDGSNYPATLRAVRG